jgi:oxygen-independent coproporphyrinogen-3 oxidase
MTESFRNALGLYFSIPFCKAKCTYCNFASGVYPTSEHERYVDRLIADLAGSRGWAESMQVEAPRLVDTVYFGGGTPVLLAPELFTRIFAAMPRSRWSARRGSCRMRRWRRWRRLG